MFAMMTKLRIIVLSMMIAAFLCIALVCFGVFGAQATSLFVNALDLNNLQNISITLKYQGTKWVYNSCEHIPNCSTFVQERALQKNNRLGSCFQRAETIEKMLSCHIPIKDAFCYMFFDWNVYFDNVIKSINKSPIDATLKFNPNKYPYFNLTREQVGYYINPNDVMEDILNQMYNSDCIVLDLKPKTLKPSVFYDDLIKQTEKLSSFSTNYENSSVNRKHNIKLALSNFNGMVVMPKQTVSFNNQTGARNEQQGYRQAHIILDKEYVDAIGGGVCQASTTLYNALLLAGVKIDEVHSHSLPSSYVELGFDAMVNYGTSDLVFTNESNTPIYLRTYATSNKVGVEVYGEESMPNVKLKRVFDVVAKIPPSNDKIIVDYEGEFLDKVEFEDECFIKKQSHPGYKVNAFLEYYENSRLVKRKLIRTVTYSSQQGIKVFGAKIHPKQNFDDKFLQTITNILGKT